MLLIYQVKKLRVTAIAAWTVVIAISALVNCWAEREEAEQVAVTLARASFDKDIDYRRWNTQHGGVYVVVDEQTQPNPWLADRPNRDLTTTTGQQLTLINPAYMTRQVHELSQKTSQVLGHITSLHPLRPSNAPDPWEEQALQRLQQGNSEVHSIEVINGTSYMRFMGPLVTTEGCLVCHDRQHNKVGEQRGGISVSVPMDALASAWLHSWLVIGLGHGFLWLLGLLAILRGTGVLQRAALKVSQSQGELLKAYDELKLSQSCLLQQEKMASIGQLAAGVAHEINNPIGFIASNLSSLRRYTIKLRDFWAQQKTLLGAKHPELAGLFAELARDHKIDYVLEDTEELINESLDGTERVSKIVSNLKTFSYSGEQEMAPLDINECLENTLNVIWNELKYHTEVIKEFGELLPVYGYRHELGQVFMNLLINASHAIKTQGTIRVTTRNTAEGVEIRIADSGCGIPEEALQRIFEPFYTTKAAGKGTGLGLSIVSELIGRHHGRISVQSTVGEGTCFTIVLPGMCEMK